MSILADQSLVNSRRYWRNLLKADIISHSSGGTYIWADIISPSSGGTYLWADIISPSSGGTYLWADIISPSSGGTYRESTGAEKKNI